jgi:hypothetical protein
VKSRAQDTIVQTATLDRSDRTRKPVNHKLGVGKVVNAVGSRLTRVLASCSGGVGDKEELAVVPAASEGGPGAGPSQHFRRKYDMHSIS